MDSPLVTIKANNDVVYSDKNGRQVKRLAIPEVIHGLLMFDFLKMIFVQLYVEVIEV
ncbi:hypothetical protein VAEKB19_5030064 [Vibrio aestuarianus]|nr:hypothetical protein VAEKB19_5030064 [Vibrio aestuarianus]